jgi:hypothetical protein
MRYAVEESRRASSALARDPVVAAAGEELLAQLVGRLRMASPYERGSPLRPVS